jgi:3-methyladenine DNA glycosylase Mpg
MDVLDEYEACTDPAFFDCGAVELAQKLLGKYLYCHQSEILVRILETEAYPAGDQVYRKLLGPVTASFPRKAGQILQLSAPPIDRLAPPEPTPPKVYHESIFGVLYITATLATDQNSRDLVLLRSCEPHAQGT